MPDPHPTLTLEEIDELERLMSQATATEPSRDQPLARIIDQARLSEWMRQHGGERAIFRALLALARRAIRVESELSAEREAHAATRLALWNAAPPAACARCKR